MYITPINFAFKLSCKFNYIGLDGMKGEKGFRGDDAMPGKIGDPGQKGEPGETGPKGWKDDFKNR